MRNIFIFGVMACLLVVLSNQLLFADPPSARDGYFKKMVIGTWRMEGTNRYNEMEVLENGTVIGKGIDLKSKKVKFKYKSTWEIINGMWVEKTIESTVPTMIGDSSIDKIASITADTFELITQNGPKVVTLRRKK
jgi:hypothetical protein